MADEEDVMSPAWQTVALGDVATLNRATIAPADIRQGTAFVGLENIRSGGGFEGVGHADAAELLSCKFAFTKEHILFGKLRPYLAKVALPEFDGVCSTDIVPILPGPRLDRRYLGHFLLMPETTAIAANRATGANLPRLSARILLTFKVPLPPLDEQRRIAAVLDKAEEPRAKRRAALALFGTLPQAIFLDMFGDPAINPKLWPLTSLGELVADGP
jgi:type I restriction enzyme S subunit